MRKIDIACIIDDDPIYVFGMKKLISIHDLCKNMLVFENGEEALKYLQPLIKDYDALPDVILLDINMPVMDGWEFLEEFIKIKPNISKKITVYMVSSSINPTDIERAKKCSEISEYFIKPVSVEELQRIFTLHDAA